MKAPLSASWVAAPRSGYLALIAPATTARLPPVQTFEELAAIARRERAERNLVASGKAASIGTFKPLERFDWNRPRTIQRELVEELMTVDFVDRGHNVLLRGPSGVGKTMLAQNLGMLALQRGYAVRFTTLSTALADLLKQESLPALERRLRESSAPSLLILDEIGWLPCSRQICRSALKYHQPQAREPNARADNEFAVQAVEHGLSGRGMRLGADRPLRPALPPPRHRCRLVAIDRCRLVAIEGVAGHERSPPQAEGGGRRAAFRSEEALARPTPG